MTADHGRIIERGLTQERTGGPYVTWQGIQLLDKSILELGENKTYSAGGRRFRVTGAGERVRYGHEPQSLTYNRYPVDFGQGEVSAPGVVDVRGGYASEHVIYEDPIAHWGQTGISIGLGPVESSE